MDYKKLELSDIPKIKPFYAFVNTNTCDFTVGGMFMWRRYYHMDGCVEDGCFYSRLHADNGDIYHNLPLGPDIRAGVLRCVEAAKTQGGPVRFCTIPETYLPIFRELYPEAVISEQPEFADYLYNASDLITLSGKKYSGQRNQIHHFEKACSSWRLEEMTAANVPAALDYFIQDFLEGQRPDSESAKAEDGMVLEVLEHFDDYGMYGGILYADDKIVGFSLGETLAKTCYVHIEKANRNYPGAYQMLVNQFSARYAADCDFINREDDAGDPGLRQAKEAYHPVDLLKKFVVELA